MKLYNPFKWHIVQLRSGKYAVRAYRIVYWLYQDKKDNYTWCSDSCVDSYCSCETLEQARKVRDRIVLNPRFIE